MGSVTSPLAVCSQAPPSGASWLAQQGEGTLGLSSWREEPRTDPGEPGSGRIRTNLQDPLGSLGEGRKKETERSICVCLAPAA